MFRAAKHRANCRGNCGGLSCGVMKLYYAGAKRNEVSCGDLTRGYFLHSYKLMSRTDPGLWDEVVAAIKSGSKGGRAHTWNARKAQMAVAEYKKRGGKYRGPKSADNSLAVWTREDWGYIDGKPGNRYLPHDVREKLTPAEKRRENSKKRSATAAGKPKAAYSASVAAKMRRSRRSRK